MTIWPLGAWTCYMVLPTWGFFLATVGPCTGVPVGSLVLWLRESLVLNCCSLRLKVSVNWPTFWLLASGEAGRGGEHCVFLHSSLVLPLLSLLLSLFSSPVSQGLLLSLLPLLLWAEKHLNVTFIRWLDLFLFFFFLLFSHFGKKDSISWKKSVAHPHPKKSARKNKRISAYNLCQETTHTPNKHTHHTLSG